LSAFEQAGVAYLAGSLKSLKIVMEGKEYFVMVEDITRAIADPLCKAVIVKVAATIPEPLSKPAQIELNFSVILREEKPRMP
jgi:hypothetical protein